MDGTWDGWNGIRWGGTGQDYDDMNVGRACQNRNLVLIICPTDYNASVNSYFEIRT